MFGSVGGLELLLILALALLLFGPRRIPEIGRALGKTVAEFRKATSEFRATLEREVELEKLKEVGDGMKTTGREAGDVARDVAFLGRLGIPSVLPAAGSEPYAGSESNAPGGAPVPAQDLPPAGPPRPRVPFADDEDAPPSEPSAAASRDDLPLG